MYTNVTSGYKTTVSSPNRRFAARLKKSGQILDVKIKGYSVGKYSSTGDDFCIGCAFSSSVSVSCASGDALEGQEIALETGLYVNGTPEYVPDGVYTITECKKKDDITILTGYDRMYTNGGAACSNPSSLPITLANAAAHVAKELGVSFDTSCISGASVQIESWPENVTISAMAGYLAGLVGKNAFIDRSGKLTFQAYADNGYSFDRNVVLNADVSHNARTVNWIECTAGDTILRSGEGTGYVRCENPIMTQSRLDAVSKTISGFTYYGATAPILLGDNRVDPWDVIAFVKSGSRFPIISHEITMSYDGGLQMDITSYAQSKTIENHETRGKTEIQMEQLKQELEKAAATARLVSITADCNVFKYNSAGTLLGPEQITLTADAQNVELKRWQCYLNGTWVDYPTIEEGSELSGSTLIVKPTHAVFANDTAKIRILTADDSVYDVITIAKLRDGSSGTNGSGGLAVLLGNEAHTIACSADGLVAEKTTVSIPFSGYVGTNRAACSCTIGTLPTGVTTQKNTAATASADGEIILVFASGSNFGGAANGTIDLTFSISGKNVKKIFSWSKSSKGHQGEKGNDGVGISSITEYYLATSSSSGVTTTTSGWTTSLQSVSTTKKYLWNYEKTVYTDGTNSIVDPHIVGTYGDKGDKGDQGNPGSGFNLLTGTKKFERDGYIFTTSSSVWSVALDGDYGVATGTSNGGSARILLVSPDMDANEKALSGKYYTLSFDMKCSNLTTIKSSLMAGFARFRSPKNDDNYANTSYTYTSVLMSSASFNTDDFKNGEWVRVIMTSTIPTFSGMSTDLNNYKYKYGVVIGFNNATSGTKIQIRKVKLESGNVATDWAPHPNDAVDQVVEELDERLNQQEIFNRLTNNGQSQGMYIDEQTGDLYINASYIVSGIFSSKNGESWIKMEDGTFSFMNDAMLGNPTDGIIADSLCIRDALYIQQKIKDDDGNVSYGKKFPFISAYFTNRSSGVTVNPNSIFENIIMQGLIEFEKILPTEIDGVKNLYMDQYSDAEKFMMWYNDAYRQGKTYAANSVYPHGCRIYGGNGASTTAWGVRDVQNARAVWVYNDVSNVVFSDSTLASSTAAVTINTTYASAVSGNIVYYPFLRLATMSVTFTSKAIAAAGTVTLGTFSTAKPAKALAAACWVNSSKPTCNCAAHVDASGNIKFHCTEAIPAEKEIWVSATWKY